MDFRWVWKVRIWLWVFTPLSAVLVLSAAQGVLML